PQENGKFIGVGEQTVRFDPDGQIDTTFGNGGFVDTGVSHLAQLANGDFIGLSSYGHLVRLDSAGHIQQSSYDVLLHAQWAIEGSLAISPTGTIVVSAVDWHLGGISKFIILQYNLDFTLQSFTEIDANPGPAPKLGSVTVQPDGKVVLVGSDG